MDFKFKISKTMDIAKVSKLGISENLLVRVPQKLRLEHNIQCGSSHVFMTADGGTVALIATEARKEDIHNSEYVYITSAVANLLGVIDGSVKEVILTDKITLGCDPEFFLVNKTNNQIQRATKYFSKWDDVGCDGVMAEVRPFPSTSEQVVTDNLYSLFKKARNIINKHPSNDGYDIALVGSSTYNQIQAGFHLHYGIPMHMLGIAPLGSPRKKVIDLMVKAMDFYIGIPSILPEGDKDYQRRTNPFINYGKPGEYRIDTRTLEYRVPGGALLKHPILTKGILGLGAVVVEDLVSRIKQCTDSFSNWNELATNADLKLLYKNMPDTQDLFKSICNVRLDIAKNYLPVIRADIEKMVAYERRAKNIKEFFDFITYASSNCSNDIEYNWREYYHEAKPRTMGIC